MLVRLNDAVALAADDVSTDAVTAAAATLPQIHIHCQADASLKVLGMRYMRTRVVHAYTMGHAPVTDRAAPAAPRYTIGAGGIHMTSSSSDSW